MTALFTGSIRSSYPLLAMFLRSRVQFRGEGSQTITLHALRRFTAYNEKSPIKPAHIYNDRVRGKRQIADITIIQKDFSDGHRIAVILAYCDREAIRRAEVDQCVPRVL